MLQKKSNEITLIVIKNSSVLDYVLPIFYHLKIGKPSINISILYCKFDKFQILGKSKFYSTILNHIDITEYDYSSFMPFRYNFLITIWGWITCFHNKLSLSIFKKVSIKNRIDSIFTILLDRQINYNFVNFLINRIILLDNRTIKHYLGKKEIYSRLYQIKPKTFLLPHAPHHGGISSFTPFDNDQKNLPDFCEFWIPYIGEKPWISNPDNRNQMYYIGYPGLDSAWINYVKSEYLYPVVSKKQNEKRIEVLILLRPFVTDEIKSQITDPFRISYSEFFAHLFNISRVLNAISSDINVVFKPHPSTDRQKLNNLLKRLDFRRYELFDDSIYYGLNRWKIIISLYTTTIFVPILAGIPTVLLHTSTQDYVNSEQEYGELYTKLQFYLKKPEMELYKVIDFILYGDIKILNQKINQDIIHVRQFFPDKATERALERIDSAVLE